MGGQNFSVRRLTNWDVFVCLFICFPWQLIRLTWNLLRDVTAGVDGAEKYNCFDVSKQTFSLLTCVFVELFQLTKRDEENSAIPQYLIVKPIFRWLLILKKLIFLNMSTDEKTNRCMYVVYPSAKCEDCKHYHTMHVHNVFDFPAIIWISWWRREHFFMEIEKHKKRIHEKHDFCGIECWKGWMKIESFPYPHTPNFIADADWNRIAEIWYMLWVRGNKIPPNPRT